MSGEWTDEEFLRYVETHAATPRALFSNQHVARLLRLAGEPERAAVFESEPNGFTAMHACDIEDELAAAWKRTK